MKIDSLLNPKPLDWYVTVKKGGKKVFFGGKNDCIRFIAGV